MEDNEKEVIDETIEETQEDVNEVEETEFTEDDSDGPTVEDYERLKKEAETLKAQKEHWRKKAQSSKLTEKKEEEFTKSNVSEEDLIRTARLASKLDDDDLEMLKSLNGSLEEKLSNPLFKAYKDGKAKKLKSESATLKPSTSGRQNLVKPDMTPEEHKAWVKKLMS